MATENIIGNQLRNLQYFPKNRQFKNEVHQCLMIIHRIPQKGFDSQDIFEDDD
jgi:hypothetical protein